MATINLNNFLRCLTYGMTTATLGTLSDQELVEKALAGSNEVAFQAIIQRHGPMVYRVCWRILDHSQDTEDAFQATFLILARKLQNLRKYASLASWLHGIAHRVALKAKAQSPTWRQCDEQTDIPDGRANDEVERADLSAALDAELHQLPEKWRLPLVLYYLEGQSQNEAATHLGCSERTFRRRLQAARDALGRRLKRRNIVWPSMASAAFESACMTSPTASPKVVASTATAATNIVGGKTLVSVASSKVTTLAEGVMKTMSTNKFKMLAILMVASTVMCAVAMFVISKAGGQQDFTAKQTSSHSSLRDHHKLEKEQLHEGANIFIENRTSATPIGARTTKTPPAAFELVPKPTPTGPQRNFDGMKEMRLNIVHAKTEKVIRDPGKQFKIFGVALTEANIRAKHGKGKPPTGGIETVVDLVGPTLSTWGNQWVPNRLLSDGKQIVLIVDWWREIGYDGSSRTMSRQHYTISLGKLAVGDYEFSVRTNQHWWKPPRYHTLLTDKQLQTKFKVTPIGVKFKRLALPPKAQNGQQTETLFKLFAASKVKRQRVLNLQYFLSRELPPVQRLNVPDNYNEKATMGLHVGACNLHRLWKEPPTKLADVPIPLQQPKRNDRIYAVLLGPVLNSGESLNLREMEWVGQKAVLRVDVWRHGENRMKNDRHIPLLVAQLLVDRPGDYEVEIEWSLLYKAKQRDVFYKRYTPETIINAAVAMEVKKSFLAYAKNVSQSKTTVGDD